MSEESSTSSDNRLASALYAIFSLCTAIVGFQIHHSTAWAVVDFFFPGVAWIFWICEHEVNLSTIKSAFGWFLN